MALAGGWLDVIGPRGFILLALHTGHNATFVTIGAMHAAARHRSAVLRIRGELFAASGLELQLRAQAHRYGKLRRQRKNFGSKLSGVRRCLATTN